MITTQSSDSVVLVRTKADLLSEFSQVTEDRSILTSAATGVGLLALQQAIREATLPRKTFPGAQGEVVAGTAVRCRESLRLAAESLGHAERACRDLLGEELIAAEVRVALDALGKVAGVVYTEDLLDRIFSKFLYRGK